MRIKLILVSVLLASCSGLTTPLLSPYKMEIRQGNYITPEMREKLKLGMSRQQVRFVLGTPMVSDAFHENRWDYAYRLEQGGKLVESQHLTAFFEGENLVRVEDNGQPLVNMESMAPEVVVAPVKEDAAKADPSVAVLDALQAWAAAWSAKNVHDYLAAYTPDYAPQGLSREKWEKQRLDRISRAKVIEVALSDTSVSMQDDDHAMVTLTQNYRSDAYHDSVQKTLSLVRQDGHWLIAAEQAGKLVPVKPSAKAVATGADEEAVQLAVKQWAEAWAARDVTQYLACYGTNFKPAGMSREKWEAQRKERVVKPSSITVDVRDLKIKLRDASHADATFTQDYRADSYHDSMRKTLKLEKTGDAWMIVAEQAAKDKK